MTTLATMTKTLLPTGGSIAQKVGTETFEFEMVRMREIDWQEQRKQIRKRSFITGVIVTLALLLGFNNLSHSEKANAADKPPVSGPVASDPKVPAP